MPTRPLVVISAPLAAAVCGLAALHIAAPAYLFGQGFPLDDAWIHAVYARELARSGALAYNPGVPATGETSPLWAIVLAVPHAIAGASIAVLLTKLVGFAMHAASAVSSHLRSAMFAAKRGCCRHQAVSSLRFSRTSARRAPWDGSAARHAGNGVGRPRRRPGERAAGGVTWRGVVPRQAGERCNRCSVAARLLDTNAAARGAQTVAVRIPRRARLDCGDQYAKHPGIGDAPAGDVLREGQCCLPRQYSLAERRIGQVLDLMPLVNVAGVLAVLAGMCAVTLIRPQTTSCGRLAAALYVSGVGFCAISFALVRPVGPPAFYHQRYVLPALLPIVAALPLLAHEMLRVAHVRAGVAVGVLVIVVSAVLLASAPGRPAGCPTTLETSTTCRWRSATHLQRPLLPRQPGRWTPVPRATSAAHSSST